MVASVTGMGTPRTQPDPLQVAAAKVALYVEAEARSVWDILRQAGVDAWLVGGRPVRARFLGPGRPSADQSVRLLVGAGQTQRAADALLVNGWEANSARSDVVPLRAPIYLRRSSVAVVISDRCRIRPFPERATAPIAARARAAGLDPGGIEWAPPEVLALLSLQEASAQGSSLEAFASIVSTMADREPLAELASRSSLTGLYVEASGRILSAPAGSVAPPPRSDALGPSISLRSQLVVLAAGRRVGGLRRAVRRPERRDFAGRQFVCLPGTFPPSSTSEPIVGLALERLGPLDRACIVDVGTGAAPIAISLALARVTDTVFALDLSRAAVWSARLNRLRLRASNVRVIRSDLLRGLPEAVRGRVAVIVANVPYVEPERPPPPWAPPGTYTGPGADGLDLMRRLLGEAHEALTEDGALIFQLSPGQMGRLRPELGRHGFRASASHGDFIHLALRDQA